MKFSGIDLHSNNSVVVISEETDRIVYQKRLPNNLEQILAALEPHRDELVGVVIESTYNWYWLVDGLMDAGYRVHLAHEKPFHQDRTRRRPRRLVHLDRRYRHRPCSCGLPCARHLLTGIFRSAGCAAKPMADGRADGLLYDHQPLDHRAAERQNPVKSGF